MRRVKIGMCMRRISWVKWNTHSASKCTKYRESFHGSAQHFADFYRVRQHVTCAYIACAPLSGVGLPCVRCEYSVKLCTERTYMPTRACDTRHLNLCLLQMHLLSYIRDRTNLNIQRQISYRSVLVH